MATNRQPRQSRSLLLRTAKSILREEGLGVGTDTLTFKRVFERVAQDTGHRLTNASVIKRVWENQADYHTDVLTDIASDDGTTEMVETLEALAPVLEGIPLATPEEREAALREVCRVGGAANIESLLRSEDWSLWIGVWALATAGEATDQKRQIQQGLLDGYERVAALYQEIYGALADLLRLRIRPGITLRHFTVAVGALAEGCTLRNRVDPDMDGILLPTGRDGAEQEWTIFGLGLEALVQRFFEPDPADGPVPA